MNHNFFTTDPDAFSVSSQTIQEGDRPQTLDEAKVSIALAAVSGGMYEIGDNLPTLGAEPERLSLVENRDLLDMARLGRASVPVDLMDYQPEDEQPSILYLREDPRQSILTIFNWTEHSRTHALNLEKFAFPAGTTKISDVLTDTIVPYTHGTLLIEQPAHSVRVFKLLNSAVPPLHPVITAQHLPEGGAA